MKKYIFLSLIMVLSLAGFSQTKIGDTTIANAGTAPFTVTVKGSRSSVAFEYVITKNSGTVAGTIVLAGTLDGTNYATLNTYTLTDASANATVSYNYNGYVKYRVTVTTTGTQNSNHKIWVLYR